MFKWKKISACLVVLFVALNFIFVSKSEALLQNAAGWVYEQKGDFCGNADESIEYYEKARNLYEYESNVEGSKKVAKKIGRRAEIQGDYHCSNVDDQLKYYEIAKEYYNVGGFSSDEQRVKSKINEIKPKSWWEKLLFD